MTDFSDLRCSVCRVDISAGGVFDGALFCHECYRRGAPVQLELLASAGSAGEGP